MGLCRRPELLYFSLIAYVYRSHADACKLKRNSFGPTPRAGCSSLADPLAMRTRSQGGHKATWMGGRNAVRAARGRAEDKSVPSSRACRATMPLHGVEMQRRLMIMRHAKSSWRSHVPTDHERPLNTRGRRDAPRVGKRLAKLGWVPEFVVSSDSRRTQETWERMQKHFPEACVSFTRALYASGLAELRTEVARLSAEVRTVLVLGHNPGWEKRLRRSAAARCGSRRRTSSC
jgi:phosphohistidine phosphatase